MILRFFLRPFFHLLYHQFAWTYDIVASTVSLGHWNEWLLGVLPYVQGRRVLEIGHGPGHLQLALHQKGYQAYGLDESRFMGQQASRRLKAGHFPLRLVRGYAQELPWTSAAFDCILSTFPTEYIFDPKALLEIHRVLAPEGRLVILPLAWITGSRPMEKLAAWLFRITGQAPGEPGQLAPGVVKLFNQAGFDVREKAVRQGPGTLLFVLASKKSMEASG